MMHKLKITTVSSDFIIPKGTKFSDGDLEYMLIEDVVPKWYHKLWFWLLGRDFVRVKAKVARISSPGLLDIVHQNSVKEMSEKIDREVLRELDCLKD